jgi:uracil DNA glycosylase
VLFGQDPYPQSGHATGRCFEREEHQWSRAKNPSLEAILSSVYYHYKGDIRNYNEICQEIDEKKWDFHSPCSLFKYWEKNKGVFLPNIALTTKTGSTLEHQLYWENFIDDMIRELNTKEELTWILWGKTAKSKKDIINSSHKIHESDHPARFFHEKDDNEKAQLLEEFIKSSSIDTVLNFNHPESQTSRYYKSKIKSLIDVTPGNYISEAIIKSYTIRYAFNSQEIIENFENLDCFSLYKRNELIYWRIEDFIDLPEIHWGSLAENPRVKWKTEELTLYEDRIDWGKHGLSSSPFLPWSDDLIQLFKHRWDWSRLSMNEGIDWTINLISQYEGKWDWKELSRNASLCWSDELIDKYKDKWTWGVMGLSDNKGLRWSKTLIEKYKLKLDWRSISGNPKVDWTEKLIEFYQDDINWYSLSGNPALPWCDSFISKYLEKWDGRKLLFNRGLNLSSESLQLLTHKVSETHLMWSGRIPWSLKHLKSMTQSTIWANKIPINSELLNELQDTIDWKILSYNQNISWNMDLIDDHINKWCWAQLSKNPKVTWTLDMVFKYKDQYIMPFVMSRKDIRDEMNRVFSKSQMQELYEYALMSRTKNKT